MKAFLLALSLLSTSLWACPIEEEQLQIILQKQPLMQPIVSVGISQSEYEEAVKLAEKVYTPIFEQNGMSLKIYAQWDSAEERTYTTKKGEVRSIYLMGGHARRKYMSRDAYLSIICHEIGHHLGGFPKKEKPVWSSAEGQADYYSTLKCLRNIFAYENANELKFNLKSLPKSVVSNCQKQFPDKKDQNICLRSAKASQDYGRMLKHRWEEEKPLSLLTPDRQVVTEMIFSYPSRQCRVDTKYQGSLCNRPVDSDVRDDDPRAGACHEEQGDKMGMRPRCWFSPT